MIATSTLFIAGGALALVGSFALELKRKFTSYTSPPGARYGPVWGDRRPPGLPASVRGVSTAEFGREFLEGRLSAKGIGGVLRQTLLGMAYSEGRLQLGTPANSFDARYVKQGDDLTSGGRLSTSVDGLRPGGATLITAWGIFNWNRDAWRNEAGQALRFPWEVTLYEEVDIPVAKYVRLWREAQKSGAGNIDAARYVRLWHKGPGYSKPFIDAARASGWANAWQSAVSGAHRSSINTHLARDLAA